jgi:hypothetical protein
MSERLAIRMRRLLDGASVEVVGEASSLGAAWIDAAGRAMGELVPMERAPGYLVEVVAWKVNDEHWTMAWNRHSS